MITTIDFETESIEKRPEYPPKPVGVAIKHGGQRAKYLAWGHPVGNNSTKEKAAAELADIWRGPNQVLCHNAKFDLDIAETHFGLASLPWDRTHDTMLELFLHDPHAASLSLKPSAERLLGLPPDEQDAVKEWLMAHQAGATEKNYAGFISKAPGKLVGSYAVGDVDRTFQLHNLVNKSFDTRMRAAYHRELQLMPILLENERRGMRVDVSALERDTVVAEKALVKIDKWLRKQLGTPGLSLDSDEDVAAALRSSGQVSEFPKTPTGRDSVSKKNLTAKYFKDKVVWCGLYYRNALATVLSMSMRPWLEQAHRTGGYIYTSWNQVRSSHGKDSFSGARSGRITCSYFQNITKDFLDRGDEYGPEGDRLIRRAAGVPELPLVRKYCLPDEGDLFVHRDYNQQEMRIVAHYEDGALAAGYRENHAMDVHNFVRDLILRVTGKKYDRRPVKIVDFRTVYGGGTGGLADQLNIPLSEARELIDSWKAALPGVVKLNDRLKERFKEGDYLRTWGGRIYRVKPPAVAKKGARKGQLIEFSYTALNYLVQPSGADITKQAIIDYHNHPKRRGRLLVTVHDEINGSAPRAVAKAENEVLRECMEQQHLDVPWRSDGDERESWGGKPV